MSSQVSKHRLESPTVSVIVPNYNHSRFLRQRIDSILLQSFQGFELILLDDASSDDSADVIHIYSRNPHVSHVIINESNSGSPFAQWKRGLDLAQGEFIWIAESDDFAEVDFLKTLLNLLTKNADAVLAYCRAPAVDQDGCLQVDNGYWPDLFNKTRWHSDFRVHGADEIDNYLKFANTIPNASAVLFRRLPATKCVIRQDLRYVGDWHFWLQMARLGGIAYTCQPLSKFRCHAATTRASTAVPDLRNRIRECLEVLDAFGYRLSLTDPDNFTQSHDWMFSQWNQYDRSIPFWLLQLKQVAFATRVRAFTKLIGSQVRDCFKTA